MRKENKSCSLLSTFYRGRSLLLWLLLYSAVTLAQSRPQHLRILEEHHDANGNVVRKVEYYENGHRVIETHIVRPVARLDAPLSPDTLDPDKVLLVINKTRNELDMYYNRVKVRSYKAVFGPRPLENKVMKGDRRTPEGWFRIKEKHPSASYNKFMLLDYPNDSSWARFERLKAMGAIPSNADIGGDVGIHGVWKGGDNIIDIGKGWTDGCIALKNADMDELYRLVPIGSRVFIRKK